MIGAWIKCGSVDENRFWLSFIGQMVSAMSQIFILGIPPRLAAVWFSADQVSTACAVGVFGNQLGVAMGFLLPPVIVPTSEDKDEIAHGLRIMFFGVASLCTALFILIIFGRLMRNRNYVLLLLSYGMNVGVFYGISTLLNQTVLQYFPGQTKSAGQIGLLIVIAGMFGSVVCGIILDKTAKFKLVTACIYGLSFVFMIIYTFILEVKILALVFLMAACLGFFMTGYLPVGFEFAAELTFPEAEGTSSGLLNASAQIFGIICTMVGSKLMVFSSDKVVNSVFCGVLLVGAILTVCIKEDLRRQNARRKASPVDTIMASPELEDGQRI
ncbi:40S ribosomal protein S20 [Armadillidium nasatum]|uniref:40S ribosomal protein S20 n=1 Tax=Armadillidium nasatum TaxID=96803 RepID=A0A5N5T029_9CRUS|nr:40S ribosomal protein S20 [Armadillidium nasatum]